MKELENCNKDNERCASLKRSHYLVYDINSEKKIRDLEKRMEMEKLESYSKKEKIRLVNPW